MHIYMEAHMRHTCLLLAACSVVLPSCHLLAQELTSEAPSISLLQLNVCDFHFLSPTTRVTLQITCKIRVIAIAVSVYKQMRCLYTLKQ